MGTKSFVRYRASMDSRTGPRGGRRLKPALAQTGRKLGPRALQTRQRLLEAAADLLKQRSVLDISVAEITRRAEASPATFYHYFKDVEEATLVLAEQAADEMPRVIELMAGPWRGPAGVANARAVVDAFIRHWDEHHAVLMIRNFAAEQGDRRFQAVRRRALRPVLESFAAALVEAQQAGQVSSALHPYAAAAAMAAILERLAAYHQELEYFGAARADLIETCALILVQTLSGREGA